MPNKRDPWARRWDSRLRGRGHRVQSGNLVERTECWNIEARFVEHFSVARTGRHCHHSDMDEFGGLFSDGMHAEQFQVVAPEEKFEETVGIANDSTARTRGVGS